MSTGITELLESFSVGQLRDLSLAMSPRGVDVQRQSLSREAFLHLLDKKKSDSTLALYAHRIEAITPYKHLWVYSADITYKGANARIDAAFPGLLGSFRETEPHSEDLQIQTGLKDDLQKRIYLKLAHQVEMSGWVNVSRTEKRLKQFRKRHPVVITLRPAEQIITVGFPGFTYVQGVQHEDRLAYATIAAEAVKFLKDSLKIECKPFSAKPAIDAMLAEEPGEVTQIRRNVRPQKGGRFTFDAGEEGELTNALTDFLRLEGSIRVNENEVRNLLRRAGASDVVLVWKRLEIVTRVALLADGPEFLFVWRGSGPSSTLVDSVLRKVVSYEKLFAKPSVQAARDEILATPRNSMVHPLVMAQKHGLSQAEIIDILGVAVAKGDFEPRFRVNTDALLPDYSNTWRRSTSEFPSIVADEQGNQIDLSVPSNIEVAFQRVK